MKNLKGKALLFVLIVLPILLYFIWREAKTTFTPLEIYGEVEMDGTKTPFTIRDFTLVDHTGDTISLADFDDKIIVANFFYATCPKVCPRMNNNLRLAVEKFKNNPDVAFLSHTVNPEHDTVEVLAEYAKKYGYSDTTWRFATGRMQEIYDLGTMHYHLASPNPDGDADFFHSTKIVLIDKERRVRGYYDSFDDKGRSNPKFVTELNNGIKGLLAEYYLNDSQNDSKK